MTLAKNILRFIVCLLVCLISTQVAKANVTLASPDGTLNVHVWVQAGKLYYNVTAHNNEIVATSRLGIVLDSIDYGNNVQQLQLQLKQLHQKDTLLNRGISQLVPVNTFTFLVQGNTVSTLVFKVYNQGCAFRYQVAGTHRVQGEASSFQLPTQARVWFFERDNDWKLKSYAGWWKSTAADSLNMVSKQGPIQGKPLVAQLPLGGYLVLTEAALYHYSGLRFKATGNNTLQANFTEGENGFTINQQVVTPWRVILYNTTLNALVNNPVIAVLNPHPDKQLFQNAGYIQPGKAVWSWITRKANFMQPEEERKFIDAAAQLNFQYTLLDEGWETIWTNKWQQLKELVQYGRPKKVGVWVWKHSKEIMVPEQRDAFLDSLAAAGVAGIKTDYMNSEAMPLIDFETGLLKAAAQRKLMVNFHGCHAPTGESITYPNEMTREGVRGMELNGMKEHLPAWHNTALPFTRFICGHGDYTPGWFSNRGNTTLAHQLALFYLLNSPFQCMAENPTDVLETKAYQPMVGWLQSLPVTWDETIVLPGSEIGKLAAFAKRKGKVWYVAVINGEAFTKPYQLQPGFLNKNVRYSVESVTDAANGSSLITEKSLLNATTHQWHIQPNGGLVLRFTPQPKTPQ